MYIELTEDNLQQFINDNPKVMVQYSASFCGSCKMIKPKFKKLASENEEVPFIVVDAEKFPESRDIVGVRNLPTFAAFQGGALKNQVQTNKPESMIALFDEIKA